MDLKEKNQLGLEIIDISHWYYQLKYQLLKKFIDKNFSKSTLNPITILDVGCGAGIFLRELAKDYHSLQWKFIGYDYYFDELPLSPDLRLHFVKELPENLKVDAVLFMDVIEHVPSELEFFNNLLTKINTKDNPIKAFITVPAFMHLWSPHDVFLNHYRRYTKKTLASGISQFIKIETQYFFYATIYPLVLVIRFFNRILHRKVKSNLKPTPVLINKALILFLSIEKKLNIYNKIAGVTLVAEGTIKKS
ncbi:class I SAM-dependent methyltransferase [Fluviispira multicolorata]|uniref:Methyltransferase domain-containing protein n=1 Tax=Fluviispira multicolorata TaxID=2654512 RepID=A0A833JCC6_9BACT|nr:methyltransferase domain-containing protein [Fluviispira multicolorata]KAB8029902.1 methyltransferase domain-containing protein [Fluviispira multicolorata]